MAKHTYTHTHTLPARPRGQAQHGSGGGAPIDEPRRLATTPKNRAWANHDKTHCLPARPHVHQSANEARPHPTPRAQAQCGSVGKCHFWEPEASVLYVHVVRNPLDVVVSAYAYHKQV
eukprot:358304-Chlamydomonas_euryale.AAC.1